MMAEPALIHSPDDQRLRQRWDVIVVGAGIGGATLGLRLAQAGRRVLFCEWGVAAPGLREGYPELARGRSGEVLDERDASLLASAGRYHEAIVDLSHGTQRPFVPFIGSGGGGSSALYGMALERFAPADFEPGDGRMGDALATQWPIRYAELEPYYAQAESLYRVRGDRDPLAAHLKNAAPLAAAPPLSPAGEELSDFLSTRGLHPYRLPSACEYRPGCASCQGVLCPADCKNDANRIALQPALQAGAAMLDRCRVVGLGASGRRVQHVAAEWQGRMLQLQARHVVVAAGALQSPLLLMRSGLGASSGLLGRGLMRHLIDLYLVRPEAGAAPVDNRRKELACNDFYVDDGSKLGTLQSFGRLPPPAMLLHAMRDDLRATAPLALPLLSMAQPLIRPLLTRWVEGWLALATIAEDLPYRDNRIEMGGTQGPLLHYTMKAEARQRAGRFRAHMRHVLRGRRWRRLPQADNNQRIAHVCGTCRFGDDPRTSVLDRDNRVHELDNVSVVDASFFPSSGGTNPALTVAANALRVADKLLHA